MRDLYNLHEFYNKGKNSKQLNNRRKSFGYQVLGFGSGVAAIAGNDNGIFGFGYNGSSRVSMTNLVSNVGVVATDTTGVGSARDATNACEYGQDKGIFAYGGGPVNMSNLVSNVGVVSAEVTGVGTARQYPGACSYN